MWRFSILPENSPERNPHESEFFRPKQPAEAIVREFIQNSLDAKSKVVDKAIVKFTFGSIKYDDSKEYFENLREHFEASEISNEKVFDKKDVPFIIIEDFGTTGLDGKTGEDGTHPDGKNNFYNFWWSEGKSEKKGGFRGRWGLGKTTFHSASDIRSYWGYTVREDDNRKLLMGKALLKTHKLNNETYLYYGYFKDEGNYKPISDDITIDDFLKLFSVSRTSENGLSIVIPFLDSDITSHGILKSALVHYFYPILNNDLDIVIKTNGLIEKIDSGNIIEIASKQDWKGTDWEKVNVEEFLNFIKSTIEPNQKIELKINDLSAPKIDENSFDDKLEEYRTKFENGELISFWVPVEIQKANKTTKKSFFELFLEKGQGLKSAEEYYIRSGITISDIRALGTNPVRGLFVADDEAITEYLGDAETPAHTTWKENTEGFKSKYIDSHKNLRFIKKALLELLNFIYLPPKERQRDFLNDLFYVEELKEKKPKEPGKGDPPEPIPPSRPQKYKISQLINGFKITPGEIQPNISDVFEIKIAYDVRNGNPFSGLDEFDLNFRDSNLIVNNRGCAIIKNDKNVIEFRISENDFCFEVTGIDLLRDLAVNIKEKVNETEV